MGTFKNGRLLTESDGSLRNFSPVTIQTERHYQQKLCAALIIVIKLIPCTFFKNLNLSHRKYKPNDTILCFFLKLYAKSIEYPK